jgi:hypothetical protein
MTHTHLKIWTWYGVHERRVPGLLTTTQALDYAARLGGELVGFKHVKGF